MKEFFLLLISVFFNWVRLLVDPDGVPPIPSVLS